MHGVITNKRFTITTIFSKAHLILVVYCYKKYDKRISSLLKRHLRVRDFKNIKTIKL